MTRPRREVLSDLILQYQSELSQAWTSTITRKRMAALRESLQSARQELAALDKAEKAAALALGGSGADQAPAMPPRGDR